MAKKITSEKFSLNIKKFKKTLDIFKKICYNKLLDFLNRYTPVVKLTDTQDFSCDTSVHLFPVAVRR